MFEATIRKKGKTPTLPGALVALYPLFDHRGKARDVVWCCMFQVLPGVRIGNKLHLLVLPTLGKACRFGAEAV